MDSVTQAALGAAVGVAIMGRRTTWKRAALVGALAGTLPDLDVFIDHGDPLMNMVRHRAESHSLCYLALLSPALGGLTSWWFGRHKGQSEHWWRWVAVWLVALLTHVLIDWMTVYGTQLLQPFTDQAYAVGSIFIIDPLYTLPLLLGLLLCGLRWRRRPGAPIWNWIGLGVSTLYMGWTALAQAHVTQVAQAAFLEQGRHAHRWVVTPTAFNTVLWRVVAVTPTVTYEGFYSLLDADRHITFTAHDRGEQWLSRWAEVPHVRALERFTQGAVRMELHEGRVRMSDLRMGQEPDYTFVFDLGTPEQLDAGQATPVAVKRPIDARHYLAWMWERAQGRSAATSSAEGWPGSS